MMLVIAVDLLMYFSILLEIGHKKLTAGDAAASDSFGVGKC